MCRLECYKGGVACAGWSAIREVWCAIREVWHVQAGVLQGRCGLCRLECYKGGVVCYHQLLAQWTGCLVGGPIELQQLSTLVI